MAKCNVKGKKGKIKQERNKGQIISNAESKFMKLQRDTFFRKGKERSDLESVDRQFVSRSSRSLES